MTSDVEAGDGAGGGSRVVRVPADVNRPDPIFAGLTARQLIVLAVVAAGCYALIGSVRAGSSAMSSTSSTVMTG